MHLKFRLGPALNLCTEGFYRRVKGGYDENYLYRKQNDRNILYYVGREVFSTISRNCGHLVHLNKFE